MNKSISLSQLKELEGDNLGTSDWLLVDQKLIDNFAETTQDQQFIHVDVEASKNGPFGQTIAHGFLTLSLLSRMAKDVIPNIEGQLSAINYGMNMVRFISPVLSDSRIRSNFVLKNILEKKSGFYQLTFDVNIEVEGKKKPAVIIEWLYLVAI